MSNDIPVETIITAELQPGGCRSDAVRQHVLALDAAAYKAMGAWCRSGGDPKGPLAVAAWTTAARAADAWAQYKCDCLSRHLAESAEYYRQYATEAAQ